MCSNNCTKTIYNLNNEKTNQNNCTTLLFQTTIQKNNNLMGVSYKYFNCKRIRLKIIYLTFEPVNSFNFQINWFATTDFNVSN